MVNKSRGLMLGILCLVLLLIAFMVLVFLRSSEDEWIKDDKGVWIKHGAPLSVPPEVTAQQEAIECANETYINYPKENISSQCIGTCWDYSIDLVHVPRQPVDDNEENQCLDYRQEKTHHFIELDKDGNIVRVA